MPRWHCVFNMTERLRMSLSVVENQNNTFWEPLEFHKYFQRFINKRDKENESLQSAPRSFAMISI